MVGSQCSREVQRTKAAVLHPGNNPIALEAIKTPDQLPRCKWVLSVQHSPCSEPGLMLVPEATLPYTKASDSCPLVRYLSCFSITGWQEVQNFCVGIKTLTVCPTAQ